MIRHSHVLDAVIEPAFFGRVPNRETLAARLEATLAQASDYEDILDRARIFGQEQAFLIGVRVLAGRVLSNNHISSNCCDLCLYPTEYMASLM